MIICSCNVVSDAQVRTVLQNAPHCPLRVLAVHRRLGHQPKCGCCAASILRLIRESQAAGAASANEQAA